MTVKINGVYTEHAPQLFVDEAWTDYAELTWQVGECGCHTGHIEVHVDGKPIPERINGFRVLRDPESGLPTRVDVWLMPKEKEPQ